MSEREKIRAGMAEIVTESAALAILLVGRDGQVLERVGALSAREELNLPVVMIGDLWSQANDRTVRFFRSEEIIQVVAGSRECAFLPVFDKLALVGVLGPETGQGTLSAGMLRLGIDIRSWLAREGPEGSSGGGGGDDSNEWLSVEEVVPPGQPN